MFSFSILEEGNSNETFLINAKSGDEYEKRKMAETTGGGSFDVILARSDASTTMYR